MPDSADIRIVATSGDLAPGTTSSRFGTFISSAPSVNRHGEVAFRANYRHQGPEGIWAERGPTLTAVAINGQLAPGMNGQLFEYFGDSNPGTNAAESSLVFNDAGQVAFRATMAGGGYFNSDGLWLANRDGSLEFIANTGGKIPGGSKSVVQIQHRNISLNRGGAVAFRGRYTTSYENDAGAWTYDSPGPVQFVGETFSAAPATTPPRVFREFAYDGLLLDDAGGAYFLGSPATTNGGYSGDNGVYRYYGATHEVIAQDGQSIAALPGAQFDGIYPFDLAINGGGQVAFAAGIAGGGVTPNDDVALFRGREAASLHMALREGTQAPGMPTGIQFDSFWSPEINRHGQLAFMAKMRGPGVTALNDEMIWVETAGGEFRAVAREGNQTPEAPAEVFFGFRNSQFNAFSNLVINAQGQVAFQTNLYGAGLGSTAGNLNMNGLWATDLQGLLRSIVIAGQSFDTVEGVTRSHGLVRMTGGTGNDEGLASGFSDRGHLAFWGTFGNSEALYVTSKVVVPEPGAWLMAAFVAVVVFMGRGGLAGPRG